MGRSIVDYVLRTHKPFAEKLAEKPAKELLKVTSNIRRCISDLSNASKLRSTTDYLSVYADYFSEFFAANNAGREKVVPYVILSERYWLAHYTLNAITKRLPNSKSPVVDEVTDEIVKLGGETLCSAILPIYRAILRSGCVPDKWNVADCA